MDSRRSRRLKNSLAVLLLAPGAASAALYVNGTRCQEGATIVARSDSYGNTRARIDCPAAFAAQEQTKPDSKPDPIEPEPDVEAPVLEGELLRLGIRSFSLAPGEQQLYQVQMPPRVAMAEMQLYGISAGEILRLEVYSDQEVVLDQVFDRAGRLLMDDLAPGGRYGIRFTNDGAVPVFSVLRWQAR
jgi:hypothetical protein